MKTSSRYVGRVKRLAAIAAATVLAVVTLGAQAGVFQEKYEGELFGVRRESQLPGFLGGVVYANGTLYVAQAESGDLMAYDDDTSAGRTVTLQDADGLIPNQLALIDVDVVSGATTESKQALLVSDSGINRVMAFDLAGNRLFTMLLDWAGNPTLPENYGDGVPVINGMSMTAGSKFVLTETVDGPSLEVQGTFAAAWAVGFGQQHPGALLVYKDQPFAFDANAGYFTVATPFRELTNGGETMEAFGVAFDAANRLFLVDSVRFTITAYDANLNLTPLFTFGSSVGGVTEDFTEPFGAAFWPDAGDPAGGRLFIADALNNRIVAYRLRGDASTLDPLFSIALPEAAPGGLKGQPYGLAVDLSTGKLAVSDDASNENATVTLFRAWVLQTRNLVAYNLETLDVNDIVVASVCAGEPYQIRFSLTVPRGRPSVAGATPSLTVAGQTINGTGVGPVDLDALETQTYTYNMTAPGTPGDLSVQASATATVATDVLPIDSKLQVTDCSAPPPTVTANPSAPPLVSGVTPVLPAVGGIYPFDVYLDATVAVGDTAGIELVEYEIFGANKTGNDFYTVQNSGAVGQPLPPVQRVVVTLRQPGTTTIKYRTRSTSGVWSALQEYQVILEPVSNRQNTEGDVLVPFELLGQAGFTYSVQGLPDGVMVDPNDVTGRRIIGTLSYVSAGTHTVTVTESNGAGSSTSWTFTWTVSNLNRRPQAAIDAYTTDEDATLTVPALGVLANDSDLDGTPLSAVLVSPPASGTLLLNANGSFAYVPALNFNGLATFTYVADDLIDKSQVTFVTITVNAVNDAPVAVADTATIDEDGSALAINVLANDSDVDGTFTVMAVTQPLGGAVTFTAAGVVFTPALNFSGSTTFRYTVTDNGGATATATVTVTVNAINDAPVAVNDLGYAPNEDTVLTVAAAGVLTNDTDADANPLTAILLTGPSQGALTLNANGSFVYTPALNFNGSDTFTYKANDGTADSAAATVTITVNAVNDAPVAVVDTATINEDGGALAINVLANDSDVDGTFTVTAVTQPVGGVVTFTAAGVVFTPALNFSGATTFRYTVTDNGGATATATVTVTVNAINDAPVAVNDQASVVEGTPLTIAPATLLQNDTDADGNLLTIVSVQDALNGTVALVGGQVVFTPAANYTGPANFTYTVSDGLGGTVTGTVTVTVTVRPSNLPPVCSAVASPSTLWPPNHKPVYLTLSGITDPDGDTPTIRFNSIWQDEPTNSPGQGNTMQDGGIEAGGTKAWVRSERMGDGDGRVYLISYTATDAAGAWCTGQVTVSVPHDQSGAPAVLSPGRWNSLTGQLLSAPPPPVAVNDTATVAKDDDTTIAVQANDTANGSPLTVTIVSKPAKGAAKVNANGTITYEAPSNWTGTTTLTYRVSDIYGGTATATVAIIVTNSSHDEDDDCGDRNHDHARDSDNRDRDHRLGDHDRCSHPH